MTKMMTREDLENLITQPGFPDFSEEEHLAPIVIEWQEAEAEFYDGRSVVLTPVGLKLCRALMKHLGIIESDFLTSKAIFVRKGLEPIVAFEGRHKILNEKPIHRDTLNKFFRLLDLNPGLITNDITTIRDLMTIEAPSFTLTTGDLIHVKGNSPYETFRPSDRLRDYLSTNFFSLDNKKCPGSVFGKNTYEQLKSNYKTEGLKIKVWKTMFSGIGSIQNTDDPSVYYIGPESKEPERPLETNRFTPDDCTIYCGPKVQLIKLTPQGQKKLDCAIKNQYDTRYGFVTASKLGSLDSLYKALRGEPIGIKMCARFLDALEIDTASIPEFIGIRAVPETQASVIPAVTSQNGTEHAGKHSTTRQITTIFKPQPPEADSTPISELVMKSMSPETIVRSVMATMVGQAWEKHGNTPEIQQFIENLILERLELKVEDYIKQMTTAITTLQTAVANLEQAEQVTRQAEEAKQRALSLLAGDTRVP